MTGETNVTPTATAGEHADWGTPKPEVVPPPTYWPAVMAAGITFMLAGVVTTLIVSGVGLIVFAVALAGWIGDIRHEQE